MYISTSSIELAGSHTDADTIPHVSTLGSLNLDHFSILG